MTFTEEDVPLLRLILNSSTHEMGMMIGGDRALALWYYLRWLTGLSEKHLYGLDKTDFTKKILICKDVANFFWTNNLVNLEHLQKDELCYILENSPIGAEIVNSNSPMIKKLNVRYIELLKRKYSI